MNRKFIVTLLRKDIKELEMITEGFSEMTEFPKAILHLAQKKADDIQDYIKQLQEIEPVACNDTHLNNQSEIEPATTIDSLSENTQPIFTETIEPIVNELEDVYFNQIITETTDEISIDSIKPAIIEPTIIEPAIIELETITPEVIEPKSLITVSTPATTYIEKELIENNSIVITEEIIEYSDTDEEINTSDISDYNNDNEQKNTVTETRNKTEIHEIISITNTETKSVIEDTKRTILADKLSTHTISRNDAMSRTDNSLSNSLANKKISDIKQAISIGDRFRFQRELFRGNGEDMNKTLSYINQLATFAEVQSFLQSKYNWEQGNTSADDFYQIVKRRFIL